GLVALPQVDDRGDQQDQVDHRHAYQQRATQPRPAQQVAAREASEQEDPKTDLTADDDRIDQVKSPPYLARLGQNRSMLPHGRAKKERACRKSSSTRSVAGSLRQRCGG